ncbi:MAG: 30S ribosomal protein S2 [Rickettsiales bacterium]|nr:30S ribosomal protein S2 [Rickettsiales bacterium]
MTDEINQNEVVEEQQNTEAIESKEDKSFEPEFTIREMLEAGVHFGHRTARWNAKMAPYIYGVKNELHIIDLTQTAILLAESAKIIREIVKRHGKILFVCTKKQGAEIVKEVASASGQFYATNKWLGGMLTNWKTISKSIKTLKEIETELAVENSTLTKKEKLMLDRKRAKLESQLGGIKEMTRLPDLVFVIDTPREALAIAEAKALNVPVMAIVDTNSNPDGINYQIPGNDDSIKAIRLYMGVIDQALKNALENMVAVKETYREERKDNRKFQSKKPSRSFDKSSRAPMVRKEGKVAVKNENKAPIVKEEAKVPTTTKAE